MGLLDDLTEYGRRSGRNLTGLLEWLGGGARMGAEPVMALMRGDAIDQPLLPTTSSGGRIGAVASALGSTVMPVKAPAGALGAGPVVRSADAALDMSPEARAARAAGMGYTVDAYHGSKGDITAFDPARLGQATDAESARNAYFFTNKPAVADTYALGAKDPALRDAAQAASVRYEEIGRRFDAGQAALDALRERQREMTPDAFLAAWNEIKAGMPTFDEMQAAQRAKASVSGAVDRSAGDVTNAANYPVKLRMQNPLVKDYGGKPYRDETFAGLLDQARAAGHDSVVFKNVYDAWKQYGGKDLYSDVYAVFDPNQARSRFAAFDPARAAEADLLASRVPLSGLLAQPQRPLTLDDLKDRL